MFQLDDNFLQQVGLGDLPADQKQAFLAYFREQLELRVGTKLSEGLSDAQLSEFEAFIDRNMEVTNQWVATNAADYQNDQVYQRLKGGAPETASENDIPEGSGIHGDTLKVIVNQMAQVYQRVA